MSNNTKLAILFNDIANMSIYVLIRLCKHRFAHRQN